MDVICSGRTLLLKLHAHEKPHLWFVLTDPEGDPPQVVAVMLRTAKYFTDETVKLEPGDHEFVKHRSSVHYSSVRFFKVGRIVAAMKRGYCHLRPDMSTELLKRVRKGLLDSPFTIRAIRDYCEPRF